MFSNKFNYLYNNSVLNYIMENENNKLTKLTEENTKLKLRIAELEKQLETLHKNEVTKINNNLVTPKKPIYNRDTYCYWI